MFCVGYNEVSIYSILFHILLSLLRQKNTSKDEGDQEMYNLCILNSKLKMMSKIKLILNSIWNYKPKDEIEFWKEISPYFLGRYFASFYFKLLRVSVLHGGTRQSDSWILVAIMRVV